MIFRSVPMRKLVLQNLSTDPSEGPNQPPDNTPSLRASQFPLETLDEVQSWF